MHKLYFQNVFSINRAAYSVEEYGRAGQATDDNKYTVQKIWILHAV